MAQLRDCMNLKMAKPAAEFSLKDPARMDVICKLKISEVGNFAVEEPNLRVEASVRES